MPAVEMAAAPVRADVATVINRCSDGRFNGFSARLSFLEFKDPLVALPGAGETEHGNGLYQRPAE